MKCLSLVFLFVCVSSLITEAQQKTIFKEDFEGYDNDWKIVNTKEFKVKQDDGKLTISKASLNKVMNGCLWYKKTIPNFFTDKNFNIQFEANTISSQSESFGFDIQWGKLQEYDGVRKTAIYQLDFTLDRVRLSRFDLERKWKYYRWSNEIGNDEISAFSIKRGVFNKFEILQEDNMVFVKLNGKLVYKMPIEYQIGNEIGFQQCLQGEWQFDNIIIKQ
ncbi:hypothetical protein [Pedobacter frigiditerrae]|uniref:hypothetical protein n=1 Tax=Pedobacter frigiditerrae TaxID=2530452 RepID=UPI0029305014|nr:hypothetical protein [Pedobacter frigiditerrae]